MIASPTSARVIVVCTANAIRSPFVEHLLRARLERIGVARLDIGSAGSAARPGRTAEARIVDIGRAHGLDLGEHRTRRLGESMLQPGTTVLCAAAIHRRVVLDMRPDLLDSTFTVREFARLLEVDDGQGSQVDDWLSLVRWAARHRTRARPGAPADDDLVDPIGREPAVWTEFERDAVAAVEAIARRIAALPVIGTGVTPPTTVPRTRREMRARSAAGAVPR